MENILHNPIDAYLFEPFLYFVAIVFTLTFFHKEPSAKPQSQINYSTEFSSELKNNLIEITSRVGTKTKSQAKPSLTTLIKESFTNPTPIVNPENLIKQNKATYSAILGKSIQENTSQVTNQATLKITEKNNNKNRKRKTGFASLV